VKENNRIEIKHMTQDQHFKINPTLKIKLLQELILDLVTEVIQINWVLSKIKCKEEPASNYITLNGDKST
jgi:hypothetical protein